MIYFDLYICFTIVYCILLYSTTFYHACLIFAISIADIHRKTKGENQTPIHYAAKNNAVEAINVLIELGANICDRDYKDQMPLFVAADAGEISTCLVSSLMEPKFDLEKRQQQYLRFPLQVFMSEVDCHGRGRALEDQCGCFCFVYGYREGFLLTESSVRVLPLDVTTPRDSQTWN